MAVPAPREDYRAQARERLTPIQFNPNQVVIAPGPQQAAPSIPAAPPDPVVQRLENAQRQISAQGEDSKQLKAMLGSALEKIDRLQAAPSERNGHQEAPAPRANGPKNYNNFQEYLADVSQGGSTVSQQPNGQQQNHLTEEEVERRAAAIADQRISAFVQGMKQQEQHGYALVADFHQNHPDLAPYEAIVTNLYNASAGSQLNMQQRYQQAINQTRDMAQKGQLPRPASPTPTNYQAPQNWSMAQPVGQNGMIGQQNMSMPATQGTPNYPSGGQVSGASNNPWAMPTAPTVEFNDSFRKNEAAEWADQRKRDQQARVR